ncbi:MAG: acetylxylan esterase [Bacteroidales bacterium]
MKFITTLILAFYFLTSYSQIPDELPPILQTMEGEEINNLQDWEANRDKLIKVFENEIYGRFPAGFMPSKSFVLQEIYNNALDGTAIRKQVMIEISDPGKAGKVEIAMLIYLPVNHSGPVPVFLGLNFYGNHTIHPDPAIFLTDSWVRNNEEFGITDNKANNASRGVRVSRWPVEYILSRGYGLATIYYGDIDPDFDDGFQNGIHSLLGYEDERDVPGYGPGSIAAWAYGLSVAMDYFETDRDIDKDKVIVFGHSRLGKASLWAGANDSRFAMVISNNSGCGGAALSMRKHGETVKAINDRFPHWFCDNFLKYNDNEDELPLDQHMLLGLIAPRLLYVASAQEDDWADPYGEQLSAYLASRVYEDYNFEVNIPYEPVVVNLPYKYGRIGYHLRAGPHDIRAYDWEQYLDFADFHFQKVSD